ncbi:helix-turn-helix domain-containing protein [Paucibacter sp. M5-1]|uniref:helix-turn-helix domain-containing protein n=1 Tax=Paucibacter sp. M5-1 TaxID=3015998 RepID=UPI0022B8B51C|nr:AraC family transcriptional regulator [Paucibacter sp. M5-1]MCZ7880067.1 AraC family transcriptional regulator ligand-binding domain-containing protein [Paucibacter sp. M5-1]
MQDDQVSGPGLAKGRPAHAGTFAIWPGWLLLMHDAGVNAANVLRRAQLPGDLFGRTSTRLDSKTYFKLWAAIEAEAGPGQDPVPLQLARRMSSDWFEPELFVALCSDDMNGALARLAKYKRLAGPMALHIERSERRTTATLEFLDRALPPPPVLMAFKLVFLLQLARLATRSTMHPVRVGWPQPPQSASEARAYADYFGVSVERASMPTLVLSAEDAQRPFLTANHGMWSFFEPALRQRLEDLNKHSTTADRVRSALLEALPAGELSMQAVCRELGVSSRTLQRRLQEEGSSFQQTLDSLRKALAHHYLQNSLMSGAEIAFLLGFEDPNSFIRAFQGWTGSTPHAVRSAYAVSKGSSDEARVPPG